MDVAQAKDAEGQQVLAHARTNGLNQKWKIVYTKDAKKFQSKGISKYSNLHIERAFYLRSTW